MQAGQHRGVKKNDRYDSWACRARCPPCATPITPSRQSFNQSTTTRVQTCGRLYSTRSERLYVKTHDVLKFPVTFCFGSRYTSPRAAAHGFSLGRSTQCRQRCSLRLPRVWGNEQQNHFHCARHCSCSCAPALLPLAYVPNHR